MSGWLLDTNVVSSFSPGRPPPSASVSARFLAETDSLYICAVTVSEIIAGIAKLRRTGAQARATRLDAWFDQILSAYDRILPFDLAAGRAAGELTDLALGRGHSPGFADTAIAAIARTRELTVLTRNLRHFEPLGVPAVDPFEAFDT